MKNYSTLLFIFLLVNFHLSAQNLLEGSITNENGIDITVATVQLHHITNEALTVEMEVGQDGYFIMENIVDGNYWLEVTAEDHESVVIDNFSFPQDNNKVMGLRMNSLDNTNEVEKIIVKRGNDWSANVGVN